MSVYRKQMGASFERLYLQLQKRLDFSTDNAIAFVGKGVMERIWNGNKAAVALLRAVDKSRIPFPGTGTQIPFSIHNYPYTDLFGRAAHSLKRTFFFRIAPCVLMAQPYTTNKETASRKCRRRTTITEQLHTMIQ